MKKLIAPLTFALAIGITGCGGGGSSSTSTQAQVRFINSAPDSTSLNLDLNETVGGSALAYLASTPKFVPYTPASYDISATEASATASLWDQTFALAASTNYVVISYGLENYGTEILKRIQVTPVKVNISTPNAGQARLIVFDAFNQASGFDTPSIDFQDGSNPTYPLTSIAYGSSATELVAPGNIAFEVLRNGTTQVYASDPGFTFVAGKTYLALVTGQAGASGTAAPQIKYYALD